MHVDARKIPDNSLIQVDICIVGAGAAGVSIALDWKKSGYKVILLEGGGFKYDQKMQDLYRGKSTGQKYYPLHGTRLHYFGGTTGHWAGMCSPFDEIDFVRSGFRAVARNITTLSDGHSPGDVFDAIWECFLSGEHGSTFNLALARLGLADDPSLIGRLVDVYRTHAPTLTLPPDSRSVLEELKGRYTLGLLTDGFLPTQRLKVQALGIEHYFEAIVYTEELGREHWKPSPRGFETLLRMLGTLPQQTACVADNESKDFIAPNRLGLLTIQLQRPAGLHKRPSPLPDAPPKLRIDRIDRLPTLLAQH